MRLFLAIPPSRAAKRSLTAVQASLRARGLQGRFTPPENLHLTLAFLGEYGDADRVLDALEAVRFAPIPLRLAGLGAFGDLWYARVDESEALSRLAAQVRRALAAAALPYDRKRFRAHITLVRRAVQPRGFDPSAVPVPDTAMTAERVVLYSSARGKSGMIYTPLGEIAADS